MLVCKVKLLCARFQYIMQHEATDPFDVRLLGRDAVMLPPDAISDLVQQTGLSVTHGDLTALRPRPIDPFPPLDYSSSRAQAQVPSGKIRS
jgi:hypothetical protein